MKRILQACLFAGSLALVTQSDAVDQDARIKVDLPDMMKEHMLGSMRDHLLAVHEIQAALAKGHFGSFGHRRSPNRHELSGIPSCSPHGTIHAQGDAGNRHCNASRCKSLCHDRQ